MNVLLKYFFITYLKLCFQKSSSQLQAGLTDVGIESFQTYLDNIELLSFEDETKTGDDVHLLALDHGTNLLVH